MIQLTAQNISRQFDKDPLFRNVSFTIHSGEKIALVGPNGVGKTTLLNLLSGRDHSDEGSIDRHPSCNIAVLEQQAKYPEGRTVFEEARLALGHLYQLQQDAERLAEKMADEKDEAEQNKLHKKYDILQHQLEINNAYNIDYRIDEVLHGLNFPNEWYDRPISTLSGGQQNRIALAKLLLQAPDLMFLDEPTNHLDIESTEWLESYLQKQPGTVFLISHDRFFLDRIANRVLELNQGGVTDYKGNFSSYWEQRKERQKVLERSFDKQQAFIAKTEQFINKNKVGTKHVQASDREKKLDRLERIEKLDDFSSLTMSFGAPSRTGDWVIDAKELAKGYGHPLFKDFTMKFHRGDCIGILGPNGSGKSTLIKTLLGEVKADAGTVRMGTGVTIAYYDQQLLSVDPNSDALEAVTPSNNPLISANERRSMLGRFGIRGDMVFQKINSLSGGERSKVALAKIALTNPNVIVLDEPTNHLDLWARESLEIALKQFNGTLLFVSHDRYFINQLATQVIVLEPDRWFMYEGNYSKYLQFRESVQQEPNADQMTRQKEESPEQINPQQKKQDSPKKRKFPYRKVHEIEADITEQESLVEEIEQLMLDPELHRDGKRIAETMATFEKTKETLVQLYAHWEEASELN